MPDVIMHSEPQEIRIEAVVIRCMCGNPVSHEGQVCPQGRPVDLGVISYGHRNPFRQLTWQIKQWLQRRQRDE